MERLICGGGGGGGGAYNRNQLGGVISGGLKSGS